MTRNRIQFECPDALQERIRAYTSRTGLGASEVIRAALTGYLDRKDREMGYVTLAGYSVRIDEDTLLLPCLGGEDHTRHPATLAVIARKGEALALSGYEEPLEIRGTEDLLGWGKLDGPAYEVSAFECGWTVSIPKALIDALLKWREASIG